MVQMVFDSAMPLNSADMIKELSTLAVLTKRRNSGDEDTKLMIAAYSERLLEYPADVVRYVLKCSARDNMFFPAWAELYEDLEFWGRDRLNLRDKVLANSEK